MLLTFLIAVAALLYSAVGHGGASGYLAAMALVGLDVSAMKPAALSLNLFVAGIAWFRFARLGAFDLRLLLCLVASSMPCAFLGGSVQLATIWYRPLLGVALLTASWRFFLKPRATSAGAVGAFGAAPLRTPSLPLLLLTGAVLGFFSGLTGVGGGIYLSPLLIGLAWADLRTTAGVSAAFIFLNSAAGLAGHLSSGATLPAALPWWAGAAVAGGLVGSHFGSRRLGALGLRRTLALVLAVAGVKMLLTA